MTHHFFQGPLWLGLVGNVTPNRTDSATSGPAYLFSPAHDAKVGGANVTGEGVAWVYPGLGSALVGIVLCLFI